LARGLGVWAKGQLGNLIIWFPKSPTDYGVLAQEGKTDFALNNPRMRTSGYLKYEFWIMKVINQPIVVLERM
jgi:hypothetical protein